MKIAMTRVEADAAEVESAVHGWLGAQALSFAPSGRVRMNVTSGTFGVCNTSDGVAGCLPWRNFKVPSLRAAQGGDRSEHPQDDGKNQP